MIDQKTLKSLLSYDPATGIFRWKTKHSKKVIVGKEAGGVNFHGYIVIGLLGKRYYGHRLAWLYMTGKWPAQVDHADNVRHHNQWENLRLADHQENQFNSKLSKKSTSGRKGVYWHKVAQKWGVTIRLNGKSRYLGLFTCPDQAHEAYMKAALAAQPEFARSK